MRNFLKITTLIIVVGLVTLINGCAKDGKDGAPGPTGATGATGNANVSSATYSTTSSNWGYDGTNQYWYCNLNASSITSSIVSTGAVLVYIETSTNTWAQLPRTRAISSSYSRIGNVQVISQDTDYTQGPNPGTQKFKVVTIASGAKITNPNVDFNDYYQVKAAFNLKD